MGCHNCAKLQRKIEDLEDERDRTNEYAVEMEYALADSPGAPPDLDMIRKAVEWERTQLALGRPVSVEVLFASFAALSSCFA